MNQSVFFYMFHQPRKAIWDVFNNSFNIYKYVWPEKERERELYKSIIYAPKYTLSRPLSLTALYQLMTRKQLAMGNSSGCSCLFLVCVFIPNRPLLLLLFYLVSSPNIDLTPSYHSGEFPTSWTQTHTPRPSCG